MSMVPLLFRDWWDEEDFGRPSRLLDQHFGGGLRRDDLINSLSLLPRRSRVSSNYIRPWAGTGISRQDSCSTITQDKDKFQADLRSQNRCRDILGSELSYGTVGTSQSQILEPQVILDVQQFTPNEITVKVNGNSIVVEGKHEEKQDEHGFISRHFVRRYVLPQTHDVNGVVSSLSSDGVLTVSAPKKDDKPIASERVVPITQTGPAKPTVQPVVESPVPQTSS